MTSDNTSDDFGPFLQQLIIRAGTMSLQFRENLAELRVHHKNNTVRDLVSEADESIEHFIRQEIHIQFPDHKIIGEELGATLSGPEDYCWFIDPIDGTVNFVKGVAYYSISIAIQHKGQTIFGAVYAPALGELYFAKRGAGAWLYQVRYLNPNFYHNSVDDCHYELHQKRQLERYLLPSQQQKPSEQLAEAVLITGFGCLRAGIQPNNYLYLGYILPHVSDVRRLGSAALDISLVAAGVFDGFWEIGLNLYDVAAACLILEESGGIYTDLYGKQQDFPYSVLAARPDLHSAILALLSEADKPYNGFRSLLQK